MEKKKGVDFGFAENVDESRESDANDSRTENTSAVGDSVGSPVDAAAPTPLVDVSTPTNVKKKRGRPRKYGPDGASIAPTLSPTPISSSIPLTGEFSGRKRGRRRSFGFGSIKTSKKSGFEIPGYTMDSLVGAGFTPHVITVNAGEDVGLKVMSLSQQGSRVVTILSANGMISKATLRQPSLTGGTLTYEGRFDIISMSGSYMPPKKRGTESQSGGMTISLAGPDGRVTGGGLAGMLIAAGPVLVVAGSFIPSRQRENKAEKSRIQPTSSAAASGRVDH